jgi:hypothetical protein
MDQKTNKMIKEWLDSYRQETSWDDISGARDIERLSRWMSRALHIGTPKQCAELIKKAINQ